MQDLASLVLYFGIGFIVAMASAWLLVKIGQQNRARLNPSEGAILRIRTESGFYRSHMLRLNGSTWTISAPLQRDNYVPIRVGEEIVIEAACKQGALLFRSKVVARETEPHVLTIQRPAKIHRLERREHRRWPHLSGSRVKLEGQAACIMDMAQGGARIQTSTRMHKGDRVRLDLPWGEPVFGWVLSAEGDETRVRFEELVELGSQIRETAPAM